MKENKTILIIEDHAAIRTTLRLALEWEGYAVLEAENGKRGLEILEKIDPPLVILLDLMMPVMNGWQFVLALHQDEELESIPVVVTTAYNNITVPIKADEFIKKPIDLDHLLQIIKKFEISSEKAPC